MNGAEAHAGFVERLERHRGILIKVADAYGRDRTEREDLAQEIVTQLWRSYGRFDPSKRFSTWMYRVAMNVAISQRRREGRRGRMTTSDATLLENLPAAPAEPDDERVTALRGMISRLGDLDRALVILYLEERAYAEIAEILGISETNVATKLSRIKARLRRDAASLAT